MEQNKHVWGLLLGCLGIVGFLPRCSCDEEGLAQANKEVVVTFVETDSCSGAQIPRRVPDDYTSGLTASTDFGSQGQRTFSVRSAGVAPLNINSIRIEPEHPEFSLTITDLDGIEVMLPTQLPPSRGTTQPDFVITVDYAAGDDVPDNVELIIESDDPDREEIRFGLTAGGGRLEVCTGDQCGEDAAVAFGNVPVGEEGRETITIKNVGNGELDLRSLRLESDSAEFCVPEATELPAGVENCTMVSMCLVLLPGESITVNVVYTPDGGGPDSGTLIIVSGDASSGNVEVPIGGTGAGPAVCPCVVDGNGDCNPVSVVDFGQADVGQGVARTVRLMSCGTDSVEITEAVLEDDVNNTFFTDPEFQVTQAFAAGTYAPGDYAEGEITYTPTMAGTNRGGLRYVISQGNLRSWLALSGEAATCDLDVLPTQLNFGQVAGGMSNTRQVVLANAGTKVCNILGNTDPSAPFVVESISSSSVAPGTSEIITVRFSPPAGPVMAFMDSFDVTSDEPGAGATTTVNLVAQGGGTPICEVVVSPTGNDLPITMRDGRLRFGAVNIGYSQTLPIRIENVGSADCVVQSINLTTEAPTQFSVATTAPLVIPPSSVGNIDVVFAPTMPAGGIFGTYGGLRNYIEFTVAGPNVNQAAWGLSISAQPTEPTIDVLPSNLDFGVVTWENPQAPDNRSSCGSVARSVNIYNSGNGALQITDISIDITSDPVFLIQDVRRNGAAVNPPYNNIMLAAGESVEVRLRFFPSRAMPPEHSGLLVIDNTVTNPMGSGAPLTVPLRGESTTNSQQTDVFQQLTDNKVDILWVVDDSGSMSEEQTLLGNNFNNFISFADTLMVDYQVAVTTTEVNDPVSGQIWSCNGQPLIITPSNPATVAARDAAFACAASVTNPPGGNSRPNSGGSDEQEAGLQAARIALDVPVVNGANAGFLRPDARLAVIIVSDEEDQSDGSVNLYIDFFRNLKGFANPQLVSLSAIAGDVPNGCATAVAGQRYQTAAQQLGGQFESICAQSWIQLLQNIGLDVFALRQAWGLSRPADPNTIVVRVNGVQVASNGTNGWTYAGANNTVTFHGNGVPPPGATIEVTYGTLCLP